MAPADLALASTINPDLILLDVEMPSTNGFEVCRKLKDDPRIMHVPVIFLTGAPPPKKRSAGWSWARPTTSPSLSILPSCVLACGHRFAPSI